MTRGKRLAGAPRKRWAITQTGAHRRALAWALAWVLALAVAAPAFALGLGQIQVRSQPGEPLLAEIPIVTSDPSELDNLQARLASPDTFRRIGLPPPEGIVSDLQFAVALDARGNPVIRVTSAAPVQQPVLNFLIEVDWGQGRLVREYAALLDAPRTVSAPAQPPIQEPAAAPADSIVRPPQAPPLVAAEPEPEQVPEPVPTTPEQAGPPAADSSAVAVTPAPAPAPAVPSTQPPEEYLVRAGDTLGRIAAGMRQDGHTLDQTMLALLRANPDAFIAGNINLVRQGAVLRMPQGEALSQYTAAEARAVVREQIGQWREMRRAAPQPEAVAGGAAGAPADAAASAGTGPRVADARLQIVPPSQGSGQRAGTRSGIEAGGEGDMLRQELQQTRETLAARDAEVEELKARLAELEQLQQQQQQLISLKDSELAAAQQRLAASNQQAATTQAATPASAETAGTAGVGGLAWLWIGLALVAAAALAWLWMRRRQPAARPRVFDTSALAAGMPPPTSRPQAQAGGQAEADPAPGQAEEPPAGSDTVPSPGATAGTVMPTWHAGSPRAASVADDAATSVSINPAPAGHERIELARAYLDLGDTDTARSLLREVVDGGDAEAREQASRLLRDLA